ncbi:MAG: hypothetical protein HLUCCA08_04680 [Rhodobacteraceae bacterium HLUCCA08]|nr:MAG: hypothetical protein HLUCCA08_04680 [Rhodobacteraceae bacterium HLUCCA08]
MSSSLRPTYRATPEKSNIAKALAFDTRATGQLPLAAASASSAR